MPAPKISFHNEDISFELKNKRILKDWILATIQEEGKQAGIINFIFCSDQYLLDINQEYLNHNTLTDIITFDYTKENEGRITGDLFLSIERIAENAEKFHVTLSEELYRVMIHGVLHLMGYKDKNPKDKSLMTKKEDFYLTLLKRK